MPPGRRRRSPAELAVVLVALGLGAFLVLLPRGEPHAAEAARILRAFVEHGPHQGAWEIQSPRGRREYLVSPDAADPRCVLLAQPCDGEGGGGCATARAVPRARAARWFVHGRADLFLQNYRLSQASWEEHEPGELLLTVWVPREPGRDGPYRWVWMDTVAGRVVSLEDRSCEGHAVRRVERIGDLPAGAILMAPGAKEREACLERARSESGPPTLSAVQDSATFPVLAPRELPRGFALVEAAYRTPNCGTDESGAGIAWLVYSDGLASFSLAMGRRAGLAALERRFSGSEGCPEIELPPEAPAVQGVSVRRHRDRCRTILRIDDLDGVGVVLIGHSEIPEAEYLRVLSSLRRVGAPGR